LPGSVGGRREFEARLQAMAKELVKWFAGIVLAHGIAMIGDRDPGEAALKRPAEPARDTE
jgi:hypothetical protein